MVHRANRPTVHDIRAMNARGQKISMLYVTTPDEAAAADAAGIDMLSIEGRFFTPGCARPPGAASCRWCCPMAAGASPTASTSPPPRQDLPQLRRRICPPAGGTYRGLQEERIAAFREFIADVNTGGYPEARHNVTMDAGEFEAFRAGLAP